MRKLLVRFLLLLVLAGFTCVASASSIVGDTVDIEFRYPDINTLYGLGVIGVVTPTGISLDLFDNQLVTVYGDHVDITALRDSSFSPASFNGVSVTDLTNPGVFVSAFADAASNVVGFDDSRISVIDGVLYINMQGLSTPFPSLARTDFNSGTTPEPGSLILLGTGALGLAGGIRRKMLG